MRCGNGGTRTPFGHGRAGATSPREVVGERKKQERPPRAVHIRAKNQQMFSMMRDMYDIIYEVYIQQYNKCVCGSCKKKNRDGKSVQFFYRLESSMRSSAAGKARAPCGHGRARSPPRCGCEGRKRRGECHALLSTRRCTCVELLQSIRPYTISDDNIHVNTFYTAAETGKHTPNTQ